jgi:flagellar basal body-associated protein FliL
VLVNVAGTAGTRYLLTNMSLVGYGEQFKTLIEEHMDQLADLASGTLANKTISDLEKPGVRNLVRTELITVFNNALGSAAVQEIYLIDFAIQ